MWASSAYVEARHPIVGDSATGPRPQLLPRSTDNRREWHPRLFGSPIRRSPRLLARPGR